MANTIKIRRSAVQGAIPTTGQLQLGELALNTYDGKLYTKKDNGSESVVELSAGTGGVTVTVGASVADVLTATGGEITADDAGEDKIVFWDDSAGKLTHLSLGTGLSITGTTIDSAAGVSDGAKGDITVSASGTTWTVVSGTTTTAGKLQLTDSVSSTSTTTAATPSSVKTAYDLADAALAKSGGALTGDLTLNAQSDLRFADTDSTHWVAFQAPATIAANITWTLPNADGTNGQVLSTNGTGSLSWVTASGGGGSAAVDVIETMLFA